MIIEINRIIITHKTFYVRKIKNQHVLNGRTDILVMIVQFQRFLNRTLLQQE